jgi:hypothetical protein
LVELPGDVFVEPNILFKKLFFSSFNSVVGGSGVDVTTEDDSRCCCASVVLLFAFPFLPAEALSALATVLVLE